MPLFMDRHDVPGATAKDVADAHVQDLETSAKHGVQFLSYWFDAEGGGVFCFADAPSRANLQAVHQESHGLIPNEIISVSRDDVVRFLGRIHDPADASEIESPYRTIVFTDMEGSTALLDALGETAFLALLAEHDVIVRRALFAHRGREVKHTGDGIMAAFDDVAAAVTFGLDVRDRLSTHEPPDGLPRLRVRIGMAAGRPVDHNDDIYGATVVLASRICDSATPGTVEVSEAVRSDGVEHGFTFREMEPRRLKGFGEPVVVYELIGRHREPLHR